MRWLWVLAVFGACNGGHPPPGDAGPVSITLETEQGRPLAPSGATVVEIVFHERDAAGQPHDVTRSANVKADGSFDLGDLAPSGRVSIEATLRNDSGAAVGYGRTALAELAGDAAITVQVRRPIAYFAGTVSRDADGDPSTTPLHWTEAPATFSDLSSGAGLDGKAQVGGNAVLVIAAGPSLYMVAQATSDPAGALTGPAQVLPIATADHKLGAALAGTMTGAVLDGAGADDGGKLVIGTTTQLFVIDARAQPQTATPIADGSFSRVAILTTDTGEIDAVAIRNRGATTGACATTAELWWATLSGDAAARAHLVATGGFSDIATDRGRAFYIDACKGELGEVTSASAKLLRTIPGTGAGASAGKPTALAVSNGQAYLGVEAPPASATAPATASLLVTSTDVASDPVRTLWSEGAQQVLDVMSFPDVRRQMNASSVVIGHLELGAGGDYVALTTSAHFDGPPITQLHIPEMLIDTEELRVFDAATGGVVQRYRSWCDGIVLRITGDISGWECAAAAGQSAPAADPYEHHIGSMTFQFGKK